MSMRSILIDVNPRQVMVDLPLDDNNTKEIERQAVAWRGIHTPIEVWIKDAKKRAADEAESVEFPGMYS
jgi:hypothetical protein